MLTTCNLFDGAAMPRERWCPVLRLPIRTKGVTEQLIASMPIGTEQPYSIEGGVATVTVARLGADEWELTYQGDGREVRAVERDAALIDAILAHFEGGR